MWRTKHNSIICSRRRTGVTAKEVAASALYIQWMRRLKDDTGITVKSVRILAAHKWGKPATIKMLHLYADAYDVDGRKVDGIATLRGDTVDMLAILKATDSDVEYAVMVVQPRLPGAQGRVLSNPSGMVEPGEPMAFAGLRELSEEIGDDTIEWSEPIDLGAAVVHNDGGFLVSPGGSDEIVNFLVVTGTAERAVIEKLHERFAGIPGENERTLVIVTPFLEVIRNLGSTGGYADLKALTSILLYRHYKQQLAAASSAA